MSVTIKEVLMDWLDINEFHNVRIDSKSKAYANTITPDEEFYLMAKTNSDDGDALEIHLNLLDKNKTVLKTIELEGHVENEEVKMTLKVEDLSKAHNLDLNAIKEVNATLLYEKEKYPTNKVRICRTLKSKELSDSSELNDIVEGKVAKAYKKANGTTPNSTGDDVKLIQTALQKMKINIGDDGVDGVFGNDGHNAVMTFQENYRPTHDVHQYTWEEPDGIAGKNTLLAMDEALVSGWKYIQPTCFCNRDFTVNEIKKIIKSLRDNENIHSTSLWTPQYASGLSPNDKSYETTTKELNRVINKYHINTCIRKIHFFAQVYHETDRFRSMTEYTSRYTPRYDPYRGRGLVHLTHESSYEKFGKHMNDNNIHTSPSILATNITYAFEAGGWYWENIDNVTATNENINKVADTDNTLKVSQCINGRVAHPNGLEERIKYVNKLKGVFKYAKNH